MGDVGEYWRESKRWSDLLKSCDGDVKLARDIERERVEFTLQELIFETSAIEKRRDSLKKKPRNTVIGSSTSGIWCSAQVPLD